MKSIEPTYLLIEGGYIYYKIVGVVYIEGKGFCFKAEKEPADRRNKKDWETYEQTIYPPINDKDSFLIKMSDSKWY
jgi:gamma-glutamylcysteine synthetase